MNPYYQTSQDFHHLHPNTAYGTPPYYVPQQQHAASVQAASFQAPLIRVVDPQIAYSRPQSVSSLQHYEQQAAIPPYDEFSSTYIQNGYSIPQNFQASTALLPQVRNNSPTRDHADPALSPIKQHINQIREEAEEWRRKWMTSQVTKVGLIVVPKGTVRTSSPVNLVLSQWPSQLSRCDHICSNYSSIVRIHSKSSTNTTKIDKGQRISRDKGQRISRWPITKASRRNRRNWNASSGSLGTPLRTPPLQTGPLPQSTTQPPHTARQLPFTASQLPAVPERETERERECVEAERQRQRDRETERQRQRQRQRDQRSSPPSPIEHSYPECGRERETDRESERDERKGRKKIQRE